LGRPAIGQRATSALRAHDEYWDVVAPSNDVHPASFSPAPREDSPNIPRPVLVIPTGNPKSAPTTPTTGSARAPTSSTSRLCEPDTVLVIAPGATGPSATLYVAPRRDHHTHEFFTDARYGELWVGARRGVDEAATYYGIETAPSSTSKGPDVPRRRERAHPAGSTTASTRCSRRTTRTSSCPSH